MVAVALAFGASFIFGLTDYVAGLASKRVGALTVLAVSQGATVLALAVAAPIFGISIPSASFLAFALLSGVAQIIGISSFWQAMTVGAMGVVAPISATGAIVPVVIGVIGGDRPSAIQSAGIVAAILGVILVSYEPPRTVEGKRRLSKGVGLALVAALGVGLLFTTLDAAAARGSLFSAIVLNRAVSASVLGCVVLARRHRLEASRRDLVMFASIGLLEITGLFLFAAATTHGLLSLVGVIAALYPVTTIALARILLKERLAVVQRVGAAGAIAGVAAIAGG